MNQNYQNTFFHFVPAGKPRDFWVITAWNPDGRTAADVENTDADLELQALLRQGKLKHFRVIGMSPDEKHVEPGWGVVCPESTALELGRRFRQEAVFQFTPRTVVLVSCGTQKKEAIGKRRNLIRDPRDVRQFTLFVGSRDDSRRIRPQDYLGVCSRVDAHFPGFTIQKADGCFQSQFEDSLLIHVSTRDVRQVLTVAHDLRTFLCQVGVGILHNGIYQRVRSWTDDDLILEAFGLSLPV